MASFHVAVVDRIEERRDQRLSSQPRTKAVAVPVSRYLNRPSDLLFVLARDASGTDPEPASRA